MTNPQPIHVAFGAAAIALLVAKLMLVFQLTVHWDEFVYLAQVHQYARGELNRGFQTFYVHLYTWLQSLPGDEVQQIIVGRMVAFGFRLGSLTFVYLIGRRLYGSTGAWVAVLATLSFSLLLRHGEEFRADPIVSFLFLANATLLVLQMSNFPAVTAAAFLLALAAAISIKTTLFIPSVILLFLAWRTNGLAWRGVAIRLIAYCTVGFATYWVLTHLHIDSIPSSTEDSPLASAVRFAPAMWSTPDLDTLRRSFGWDLGFWLLLAAGTGMALSDLMQRRNSRFVAIVLVAMLIPLGSLATYRFSYAYFYTTIIPGASLVLGLAAARLGSRVSGRAPYARTLMTLALVLPITTSGWWFYSRIAGDSLSPQRTVLRAIREMFPDPVPYIDRCHMVATHQKTGLFMTVDVLQAYREQGRPVMHSLVRRDEPPFLIANVSGLELDRSWEEISQLPHQLLREDFEYLQSSYIHHWGPIWVAGARVTVVPDSTIEFEIPITDTYTLESTEAVSLDGAALNPGSLRRLDKGTHRLRSEGRPQTVVLRIGNHLKTPAYPPPPKPVFLDMGFNHLPLRAARR